ncbi:S41 family peptidase [Gaetbulibacter jejuensis]
MRTLLIAIIFGSLTTSCFEDRDDNVILSSSIHDFVWKGMNAVYLYKAEIPDLANDRFTSNEEYGNYLNSFSSPEELFESLIYQRQTVDRFSIIVDDYIAFEQALSGTTVSNGMEFGLFRFTETSSEIYGYVRYVMPNTSAESQGIKRGDIFYGVDGTQLTIENANNLLGSSTNSYSINIGVYNDNGTPEVNDDSVDQTTETIELIKTPYTENPILTHNILNVDGNNVGYLMYNSFTSTNQFDSELNSVFGEFQSANITDLVLDLRYNGGGSVNTAIWLSSMITGQFTGDLFIREEWNNEIQAQINSSNPESLLNPFVDEMIKYNSNGDIVFQENINHLNLNKVYILTTRSTASASELIINGLNPYIDVVQIGATTTGKYQASTTIYDSPDLGRQNANPNHTYALQPLIFKSINSEGFTDYDAGFVPQIQLNENLGNLGVLGDINEPLLAAAILDIQGIGRIGNSTQNAINFFKDSNDFIPFSKNMYINKPLNFYYYEN